MVVYLTDKTKRTKSLGNVWKGKCRLAKGVNKQPLLLFIFLFTQGKHPKFNRGDLTSQAQFNCETLE